MKKTLVVALMLGMVAASGLAFNEEIKELATSPVADPDFARGVADAKTAYKEGYGGLYFYLYTNMPSGPDDPVLARERDVFVALLTEKGIKSHASNSGCIDVPGLHKYSEGYNSIADARLKKKFGADYMEQFKREVARRIMASPAAAA